MLIYGRISLAQKRIYIRGQSQAQKGRINATNREVIKNQFLGLHHTRFPSSEKKSINILIGPFPM